MKRIAFVLALVTPLATAQTVFTDACGSPDWFSTCTVSNACGQNQNGCLNNWFDFVGCGTDCPLPFPGPTAQVIVPAGVIATLNGGTADIYSIDCLRPFILNGSFNLRGDSTFANSLNWTGGGFSATSTAVNVLIPAGSPLAIYGDNGKFISNAQLILDQGTTWEGAGGIGLSSGASIISNAVFAVRNDVSLAYSGGTLGSFENYGTFRKLGSSGTTTVSGLPLNNHGTIEVLSGTLRMSNNGTSYGPIELSPNTILETAFGNYNFDAGTVVTGVGVVRINGTLNLLANIDIDEVELQTSLNGPGDLRVVHTMQWPSGSMSGGGTTVVPHASTLTLTTSNTKNLANRGLENNGMVTVDDNGSLNLSSGADLTNAGTLDIHSDASINYAGGVGCTFSNTGTLQKSAGAGTSIIGGLPFMNGGLVDVQSGTLRLSNSGVSSGPFTLANGTVLEFAFGNYNFAAGSSVTGDGLARMNGTTNLLDDVSFDNVELTASLNGPGDLTVASFMTWPSGTMSNGGATIIPASVSLQLTTSNTKNLANRGLENSGIVTLDDNGSLNLSSGADLTNAGTLDIHSDASISYAGGVGCTFSNTGTLRKSAGTGTSNIGGLPFMNGGLVDVQAGTLRLSNSGVSSGPFTLANGTVLEFAFGNYNFAAGSSVTGDGLARMNGTTNLLDAVSFDNVELTANLSGPGNLTVAKSMVWPSGTMSNGGTTIIPASVSLQLTTSNTKNLANRGLANNGIVTLDDNGSLNLSSGADLTNTGTLDIHSDASVNYAGGVGCTFSNTGTLRKSAGTGTTIIGGLPFMNSGMVDVQSGTLRLSNSGVSSGPFTLANGTVLEFAFGNYNFAAGSSVTGDGLARMNGTTNLLDAVSFDSVELTANLNGPGDLVVAESMSWLSGTMAGGGTTDIPSGATMQISTNNGKNLANRALHNAGEVVINGSGAINMSSSASFLNEGVLELQSSGAIAFGGGTACSMTNSGSIQKSIDAGVFQISGMPFNNSGAIDVQVGTLNISNFTQMSGGTHIAAGAILQSGAPLALQGGVLTGAGSITGALANSGGIVQPGDEVGTLTISGPYSQSAAAALEIELAGMQPGQFDTLAASGAATLGGTLRVMLADGFVPHVGDTFQVLTAGTIAGQFAIIQPPAGVELSVQYTSTVAILTITAVGVPGDLNCDGNANNFDIDPFVLALVDPSGYAAQFPNCDRSRADINGDGEVNNFDIDPFVQQLTGR